MLMIVFSCLPLFNVLSLHHHQREEMEREVCVRAREDHKHHLCRQRNQTSEKYTFCEGWWFCEEQEEYTHLVCFSLSFLSLHQRREDSWKTFCKVKRERERQVSSHLETWRRKRKEGWTLSLFFLWGLHPSCHPPLSFSWGTSVEFFLQKFLVLCKLQSTPKPAATFTSCHVRVCTFPSVSIPCLHLAICLLMSPILMSVTY